MRLGVTGRSRTGTCGFTFRSSAIELRPHPSARLSCWSRRQVSNLRPDAPEASALPTALHRDEHWLRTMDLLVNSQALCHLRYRGRTGLDGQIARLRLGLAARSKLRPVRSTERTDAGLRPLGCNQTPSAAWLRRDEMASRARLERATSGFVGRRSDPTELTRLVSGASCGIRTRGFRLDRPAL